MGINDPLRATNFPGGVSTALESDLLGALPIPDPSKLHLFWDDFDNFKAGAGFDWLATAVGAGINVVTNADGGILLLTNAAADDNSVFVQWLGSAAAIAETFRWAVNKRMWFKSRFKVSDATQSDLVMGLQIVDTTPLDVTDGIFFHKADGSATLNLLVEKDNTASTIAVGTMANDTYVEVGWNWDPQQRSLSAFLNGNRVGSLSTLTNFPDDEDLAISFGVQNGEAVAKTMSIDYILAAKER